MGRAIRAGIVAVTSLAIVAVSGPGVAGAQDYPPASVAVDLSALCTNRAIVVTGSGFPEGTTVTVVLESTVVVLGTPLTDANGRFSLTAEVAPDLAGTHTVRATSGPVEAVTTLVALCPPPSQAGAPPAGALPRTGSDALPLSRIGIALVAIGGFALALTRRRRGARSTATDR